MLYKYFLNFFSWPYNKNNYLWVKKLFHLNLSILSVIFIFSKYDIFNFFQNYLKKSLILPLKNDLSTAKISWKYARFLTRGCRAAIRSLTKRSVVLIGFSSILLQYIYT